MRIRGTEAGLGSNRTTTGKGIGPNDSIYVEPPTRIEVTRQFVSLRKSNFSSSSSLISRGTV